MYVDFRLLLPIAGPFICLAVIRVLWAVAGASWSDPTIAAVMSLITGGFVGGVVSIMLFAEDKPIGGFWIGGRK